MNSPTGSDSASAIRLDDVEVSYRVPKEEIRSFKEYAIRWAKREIAFSEFLALQGVSLDIRAGEIFGVIGPNGAGKSTLLKVISRVLRPTRGRVRVRGRMAPLLELGAGFNTELTGRENIFMNGAILGRTQAQIAARFDAIVDFSGIRAFINMPLRTYSTGMVARLGFAIATDVKPDILLIDEVLSVGDAEFQKKASERIEGFKSEGVTVLLVSHSLNLVRSICRRAAWIANGRLQAVGSAADVVSRYQESARSAKPA
jgi:ABC-2 type transport system ATP-binding protein/lipopolysaccharide transport system ATP-binding protein